MEFVDRDPSLENYWRSIILFGRNVASYKFALAKAITSLEASSNDLIKLDDLAAPFALNICEHLKSSDKQSTSSSSKFLNVCRSFNEGTIGTDELITSTTKLGFVNVIDAFHIVNKDVIANRFFIDERRSNQGIRLTDNYFQLIEQASINDLDEETEARWKLVEEGWRLGVATKLIDVVYDKEQQSLIGNIHNKRIDLSSVRGPLNGYQKGKCFYCRDSISIVSGSTNLCHVDHFFPYLLTNLIPSINGVWNLVLACSKCNGASEKHSKIPSLKLLEALHRRNEYYISSHLPLHQAIKRQTGESEQLRKLFLQQQYDTAKGALIHTWEPSFVNDLEQL